MIDMQILIHALIALVIAMAVCFSLSPVVKVFATKVGAIDVPKDNRRMHKQPIPRLGGLAIFMGFMVSVLIMVPLTDQLRGMLFGAVIIVVLGVFDDVYALGAKLKFMVQIVAALIAVFRGNVIDVLSNPNFFSSNPYWNLGWLSIPVTVIWIVAITNAVNLIDGLDGLAVGVSGISSIVLLVIALLVSDNSVAMIMAGLAGACLGFMPYNLNPAKMFMGDTGATFLGYTLAVMSIQGLFKLYTVISFIVPFLMLGLPIFDISFAVIRRISEGHSPMTPDRSHIHHRLIDMGMNQKQAVAVLYVVSAILGLTAVVLATTTALRAMIFLLAVCATGIVVVKIVWKKPLEPVSEKENLEHTVELPDLSELLYDTTELPDLAAILEDKEEKADES